jgi:hypothetical protein
LSYLRFVNFRLLCPSSQLPDTPFAAGISHRVCGFSCLNNVGDSYSKDVCANRRRRHEEPRQIF